MRELRGFTLVELLVALAVATILAAIAVPGARLIVNRGEVLAGRNNLSVALNYARSAAITSGTAVSICQSGNGSSCGGSWTQGWIVFSDTDGDASLDAGEEILRAHSRQASSSILLTDSNGNSLTVLSFNNRGFTGASSSFSICDESAQATTARAVLILASGRILHSRPGGDDGIHHDINNSNLSC